MSRYIARQDQVVEALGDAEIQALVVSDLTNVRYLCGYVGSNGTLVISPSRRVLLTDFRYLQSAAAQTTGVEIVEAGRDLAQKLAAVIGEVGATRVGFESTHVSHARHGRMVADLPGVELVPTTGIVESVRLRKDADEIDVIARASKIADLAFQACVDGVFRGRTERAVAWELGSIMRAAGADGPSFDIIVASGERGAMPHAVPAEVPIPADTLVARARLRPAHRPTNCFASTTCACRRSRLRCRPCAPESAAPNWTRWRERRSSTPATATSSATASATASACRCTRIRVHVRRAMTCFRSE
jgi:Xaa-Pro aminopeptidase